MKKMSCKQLGVACEEIFEADTFDEISELSKAHGIHMMNSKDQPHLDAMNNMMAMTMEEMHKWLDLKKKEFEELSI